MKAAQHRHIARRWPLVSGTVALAVAAAVGLLVVLRESPLDLDADWMAEVIEHRSPYWQVPALLMDRLGGGVVGVFVVPLGLVALLLLARRPWGALYSIVAAAASAGVVQLLKSLFARARPEDILVTADFGSFPSGHVANAATVATTLIVLFGLVKGRGWVWMLGIAWVVMMALSRTYLGAHWVTDTLGGALIGAAVAVIVWAPLAGRLAGEPRPRDGEGEPTGAARTPLTPAEGAGTLA